MSLMPIFGGRSYNGMTALQILQELQLTTGLQLCLDAGDAASYTSGQKWLDRSGNGYDFNRGVQTSSAVAISGTANGTYAAATSIAGVATGTAAADRMVVVCLTYENASNPTSLIIGGIAATQLALAKEATADRTAAIWAAMVPTGTTATISWTGSFSGGYSVFRVTGLIAVTASATLTDITNPLSGAIDIPANGGMIACMIAADQAAAVVWTGATEYSDFDDADGERHSAASRTTVAAETGHTVAVDGDEAMAAVSWAPDPAGGAFTNEPTFNGTPGALDATNFFSFDGDFLRYDTSNENWINDLHKNNAAFTILSWLYPPAVSGTLFGTNNNSASQTGIVVFVSPSIGAVYANVSNGTGTFTKQLNGAQTSVGVTASAWQQIGLSVDEAADSSIMIRNSTTLSGTAAYTSPSSLAASYTAEIGARGNGGGLIGTGARMAVFMAWSRALAAAEISSIFSAMRGRFGV